MSPAADVAGRNPAIAGVIADGARLLFVNGQTTERMVAVLRGLASRKGLDLCVFPRWGELTLLAEGGGGSFSEMIPAAPAAVDMRKVIAATEVLGRLGDGSITDDAARSALEAADRLAPIPVARFAAMAGAGAAALGVIFGATHPLSLGLIAFSAGAGACLRRWLSRVSHNLFVQPFCAALLAGLIGAAALRLDLSSALRLVAVCPCMVLVPGPHILNGAIDLIRGRIGLGAARTAYACLIMLVISTGLLLGLGLLGEGLPASGPSHAVPLGYDVLAAGVAVAAYGTFFAMPWRLLPIPVAIGMVAHALRWAAVTEAGAGLATGALAACLVVGAVTTPIANRLHLPFAAFAFAAVVSMMPGVLIFRMAAGLAGLVTPGPQASPDLLIQAAADGATALLVVSAMVFGLLFPKMCIEHFAGLIPSSRKLR